MGQACSMGSLLLTAGSPGMRHSLPHARIMVNQPSGYAQGILLIILVAIRYILNEGLLLFLQTFKHLILILSISIRLCESCSSF